MRGHDHVAANITATLCVDTAIFELKVKYIRYRPLATGRQSKPVNDIPCSADATYFTCSKLLTTPYEVPDECHQQQHT